MSVFGELWTAHEYKLQQQWQNLVSDEDLVIIPGDISWAMRETEVREDLNFLKSLPGEKVILKGNHDYWWNTRKKVQELVGERIHVLQNNALVFPGFTVVGSRGWELPTSPRYNQEDDEAIYLRELSRLQVSLEEGKKSGQPLIAAMHYPPLTDVEIPSGFSDLLEAYNVTLCIYGHLHGQAHQSRVEGLVRGIRYQLVAADFLNFVPLEIGQFIASTPSSGSK